MDTFHTIIIGGGPGGTAAAQALARAGKKTALISNELGGECLNWGCIPTKIYLWTAELIEKFAAASVAGIDAAQAQANWQKMKDRRAKIVEKLKKNLLLSLEKSGVKILNGTGALKSPTEVIFKSAAGEEEVFQTENIIIATGSVPKIPNELTVNENVLTNHEILDLEKIPETLLIIGGGVIGVEFASLFASLGSNVTIMESGDRLLPAMDSDTSAELEKIFARRNIKILKNNTGAPNLNGFEKTLIAVGRRPSVEGLNLDAATIKYSQKGIETNEHMQTSANNIYAIGDAAGKSFLAYTAEREGEIAAQALLKKEIPPLNYNAIPWAIFCSPEIASVGVTEQELQKKQIRYIVGKALFSANSKALILGARDGFVKIVVETSSRKIIGAHIIGEKASELIAELSLAVSLGLTIGEFSKNLHGHPVLNEIIKEACSDVLGKLGTP